MEKSVSNQNKDVKNVGSNVTSPEDEKKFDVFMMDLENIQRTSLHDLNVCIEKIEELSMECKSLLHLIKELEKGNTEFFNQTVKEHSSPTEEPNSSTIVAIEVKGGDPKENEEKVKRMIGIGMKILNENLDPDDSVDNKEKAK